MGTDLNELKQGDFAPRLENAKYINNAGNEDGTTDPVTGVRTPFLAVPAD